MNKYSVIRNTAEFKNIKEVFEGCTIKEVKEDVSSETIATFDTKEEAQAELAKQPQNEVEYMSGYVRGYYHVTEYLLEIYKADEDGEFLEGSNYETHGEFKIH